MIKRLGWLALGGVALATFLGGGWLLRRGLEARDGGGGPAAGSVPTMSNRLFQDVVRHVRSYAVDSLDESAIYRLAADGMLHELEDPYAAIIPGDRPDEPEPYRPVVARGMYLDLDDQVVVVVSVLAGGPAASAGVRMGDVLLEVDGRSTEALRPEDVAAALTRDPRAEVRVRLVRAGSAPLRVTIPPGSEVPPPPPLAQDAGAGIVHVRVYGLTPTTGDQVADGLRSVLRQGATGVVLDLRGAVEGELADAVALATLFLPRGSPVVVTRGREPLDSAAALVERDPALPEMPLVVLIDRGTAGAAEVVAGALQDHDRALVVGEPSFGRGVNVSYFPLGDGSFLRLTTGLWYTPSGRLLQRPATIPNDDDTEEVGRPEYRTAADRIVLGGGGIVPDREIDGESPDGAAAGDAALALARQLLARARTTRGLLSLERP